MLYSIYKMELQETCNTQFKNMINESAYVNPTDKPALMDYYTAMDEAGGTLKIKYAKNVYNGNEWGRLYPQGYAKPLTYQWSSIRALTCAETQVDVDIKKCHPSILLDITKKNGWDFPLLNKIVNDFDEMVERLKINSKQITAFQNKQKSTAGKTEIAKLVYTVLLYGAGADKINDSLGFRLNPQYYIDYKTEVKQLAKKIISLEDYGQIAFDYRAEKSTEDKSDNACLSLICQELESRYVVPLIERFQTEGIQVTSYIYDGFQCKKSDKIQGILDEVNASSPVEFIVKPWKAPLTMTMDFEPFKLEDQNEETEWDWLEGVTCSVAKHFCDKFGEDFIFSRNDKAFYFWNTMRWVKSEDGFEILKSLSTEYPKWLNLIRKQLLESENRNNRVVTEERLKKLAGIIKKVDDYVFRSKLVKECQVILGVDIPNWELNPYHFCFNNAVFDLKTGERIKTTNKDEYMTLSTGYNYIEPEADDKATIETIVNQIFPVVEERVYYMTLLSTGLYGKTLDRFTMANGSGGNGKNVINDIMLACVGDYGTTMSPDVLQSPLKKGATPETAVLDNKRLVISREPEEGSAYFISTIKSLTGGALINTRMLYSNRTTIANKGTYICECNTRPSLNGKTDNSVMRRLVDVLFRTTFVDQIGEDIEEGKYQYLKNMSYTDQSFQLKMRSAMFSVVFPYFKRYLDQRENMDALIPNAFKQRMMEYVAGSDSIYQFLLSDYEIVEDKTQVVKIRDFYNAYKGSEDYRCFTREEKRGYSEKRLIDNIAGNHNFTRLWRERYNPMVNGVQEFYRNVLIGVKRRNIDEAYESY